MGRALDITGQRFGSLVAVEKKDKRTGTGLCLWLFKCDCGEIVERCIRRWAVY